MDVKARIKTINMIYSLLLGSVFILAMGALYLNLNKPQPPFDAENSLLLAILLIAGFSSVFSGFVIFNKMTQKARLLKTLPDKLRVYQTAITIKLATLHATATFAIVLYLVTSAIQYLVIAAVAAFLFRIFRPNAQRIVNALGLNQSEIKELAKK
jgi:4-hydroxybenzoate polyprenyltransferase